MNMFLLVLTLPADRLDSPFFSERSHKFISPKSINPLTFLVYPLAREGTLGVFS